jgi:hypothetical protein
MQLDLQPAASEEVGVPRGGARPSLALLARAFLTVRTAIQPAGPGGQLIR